VDRQPPTARVNRNTIGPHCPDIGVAVDLGGTGKTDLVRTGFGFASGR
jgi:hypothetical protein